VIAVSRRNLADLNPTTVHDIRHAGRMVIQFSPDLWTDLKVIRQFLFDRMYRAPAVVEMRVVVTKMVNELFPFFMDNPDELPKQWRKDVADAQGRTALARIVADYIAGMTDRFAIQEHKRLIGGETIPPGVIDGN
jgi:dGTPase